jgi:hypothetical protein
MSKKNQNIEETMETDVVEVANEVDEEVTEVKESKIKKVWQKIKKPAGMIGLFAGGMILGNIIAGRNTEEDMDFDCFEVDDVVETTEE